MNKIKFILITKDGERITNDKMYSDDDKTWFTEDGVGCVMQFDGVPMIQDYQEMANKIALVKQFECGKIFKFETELIK